MKFEDVPVSDAEGWALAHSVSTSSRKLAKGTVLSKSHIEELVATGVAVIHGFRLEEDDIDEDEAALRTANHLAGSGLRIGKPTRGRCNLYAEVDGLVLASDGVDAFNAVDEALTVATLGDLAHLRAGQLVATIKVIPYALNAGRLQAALVSPKAISLAPFRSFTASFIVSGIELSAKTRELTEHRIEMVGGRITDYAQCPHTICAVTEALETLKASENDLILMLGVSAISDRRDVLPAALVAAGGEVTQLGMPVDPGNLLMLGKLGGKTVLGLPGCARSPTLNGLDWVLERFAANLPLTAAHIRAMGNGGLLKETSLRPEPRAPRRETGLNVQALILAAGKSSRAGDHSKLLRTLNGKTVVAETVATASRATDLRALVITGHESENVEKALSGYSCEVLWNEDYANGMGSSLSRGIQSLSDDAEFALICLGDMPFVREETITSLMLTSQKISEARIFIPTFNGKRGHPVLWHKGLFGELKSITGDKGGRDIIRRYEALVCEVPVADPGILIDLDTPELLAQFGLDRDR